MLVLLWDVPLGAVWYAWPVALGGVLAGAAAAAGPSALRAGIVAAAGLSMIGLVENRGNTLIVWLFLALSMAAVAVTVGSAARALAEVDATPALAALGTLAALGVFGSLNLLRSGGRTLGSTVDWVSALLVLGAAALLLCLPKPAADPARGRHA